MNKKKLKPGFRISFTDVLIIISGCTGALLIYPSYWQMSLIILLPVFHFFLFCNIFRIARNLELIWAFTFIILAYLTSLEVITSWTVTSLLSLLIAGILIRIEIKKPTYHGILWRKINPNLQN